MTATAEPREPGPERVEPAPPDGTPSHAAVSEGALDSASADAAPDRAALDAAPTTPTRLRGPVVREDAVRTVRLLAVAFGVTVVVTRLYLALTGYPQIGGGEYHLAHALWGGVLLLAGGVVALLWSNRWVQPAMAVCVGVGSGLFVDEVGKFITRRNDYFTPLAAPIIYSTFLAVLGVVVLARHVPKGRPRELAYAAVVRLKDLADGPLRPATRTVLLRDLDALRTQPARPDLAMLAGAVHPVVEAAPVETPRDRLGGARSALARTERVLLPRWVHRLLLAGGSAVLGLLSLVGLAVLIALLSAAPDVQIVLDDRAVAPGTRPPALVIASAGEAVVGVVLLLAALALLVGRDRAGTALCRAGLVIALAFVNVALGYLDAELVVIAVVVELLLLVAATRYRTRFLHDDA
ncbi:hypothetical protein GCM10010472_47430 [Pseudonocardia halophobica]|uniref:Uncharacterized protein n=1 Tax=Pseudonocardia halophobica TaxID=29401 RepID=A0A9W6NY69_9PSEU|nr:hypothetical protein [Pseudonocardia halophobica]GLL13197.1 hypothetical protein GCM10017577_43400 [Pseudonocardia halophobica]